MDLDKVMKFVSEMVQKEAEILTIDQDIKIIKVKDKEKIDIQTDIEHILEERFYSILVETFPEVGFEMEDSPLVTNKHGYRWVIDVIDGTKYFFYKIPLFSMSVALVLNDKPVLGVIYNPISKQLYTGSIVQSAQLNGVATKIKEVHNLNEVMLNVDISKHGDGWDEIKSWVLNKLHILVDITYRVRMFGVGALSLAWLGSGSLVNGYVSLTDNIKFVDVAAGLAICEAAGARVIYFNHPVSGKPCYIVACPTIADQLARIILN
ncbi:MAG: inositol monophosphatase [Patescibacteria group bacterium]